MQLHFTDDSGEEPVELYHKLKLYGEDDPSGQASTKKPVSHLPGLKHATSSQFTVCVLNRVLGGHQHMVSKDNSVLLNMIPQSSLLPFHSQACVQPFDDDCCQCWQVVSETYEELVFSEPAESFYQRVANHMPMPAPPMSQAQWFTTFSQQEDLRRFNAARQRVAGMTASVQRQLEAA